jgi:DNA-binding winged helix-turn-helix (wHTH) protein
MQLDGGEWFEFGRFRVLPRERQLLAGGIAVELGSRAFDVLMVLLEAEGGLVTKDQLLDRVWPGTVVEENNIQVQISALRKALGEDRNLILTVPLRGYRFTGYVRAFKEGDDAAQRAAGSALLGRDAKEAMAALRSRITRHRHALRQAERDASAARIG